MSSFPGGGIELKHKNERRILRIPHPGTSQQQSRGAPPGEKSKWIPAQGRNDEQNRVRHAFLERSRQTLVLNGHCLDLILSRRASAVSKDGRRFSPRRPEIRPSIRGFAATQGEAERWVAQGEGCITRQGGRCVTDFSLLRGFFNNPLGVGLPEGKARRRGKGVSPLTRPTGGANRASGSAGAIFAPPRAASGCSPRRVRGEFPPWTAPARSSPRL